MLLRVTIFEDIRLIREYLQQIVDEADGMVCTGAYDDCTDLINRIEATKPHVVLMDIEMPGIKGIEAVQIIKKRFPDVEVLMQTEMEDDDKIFASICAGASGYLLKNTTPEKIIEAIFEVHKGGVPLSPSVARKVLQYMNHQPAPDLQNDFHLSPRELEVVDGLVKGLSYKLIADVCSISIDTVKFHSKNIYRKLHVNSKSEVVIKALKNKIV
ncbi:MAG: response regulator transcription factor [Chitinophagaceae bacterium]|nr:response regulator transcription factor [Chitinophagaceae bacterium]